MFVWWLYIHTAGIITRCLTSLNLLRPFKPIISFNKISVLELPVLLVGWNISNLDIQTRLKTNISILSSLYLIPVLKSLSYILLHIYITFIEFPVTKTARWQACQAWFYTECLEEGNILSVLTCYCSPVSSTESRVARILAGDNAWCPIIDQNFGWLTGPVSPSLIRRELRWELRGITHHHSPSLYRKCLLCAGAGGDIITSQTPGEHTHWDPQTLPDGLDPSHLAWYEIPLTAL